MNVVFLSSAEEDLHEIRRYVIKAFGNEAWLKTKAQIKASTNQLKLFPLSGSITEELTDLGLTHYRQQISGMNRIIYEVADQTVYIHIVCDARRNAHALLSRRLLRATN